MDSLAEQIFIDILKNEMGLTDQQCWVRSQTRKIPNDTGLYIVAGMADSEDYGVNTEFENFTVTPVEGDPYETLKQIQTVSTQENIQIDIYSRDNQALKRRWEIRAALSSLYSKQAQEKNFFKIGRIPKNFVNSSVAEGGSNLNKFSCVVPALVWYKKEKILDPGSNQYYDDFKTRVDDEVSIGTAHGVIEFEIDETGVH